LKPISPYSLVLIVTALLIAVIMQVPQLLHMQSPLYHGVLVQLNSDEDVYLAHLEESLTGRPEQSNEAIVGDPSLMGSHAGSFERIEGTLLRPTGLRAATVEQIMDSVVPSAIFLALILFFSLCRFSRWASYIGACAFVLIELYSLNRPVQPRGSFLLLILALSAIIAGLEPPPPGPLPRASPSLRSGSARERGRRLLLGCIGGAILGMLVGVYFWAWTFGWLWFGLLFVFTMIEWWWHRSREALRRVGLLCLFGLITAVAAVPSFLKLQTITRHPLYADAVFRSGVHAGRLPESWPYSILFTVMAIGVVFAWWKRSGRDRNTYATVTVVTAFVAIHQQILHGVTFNFVSHYLFALVMAAICVVMMWHAIPSVGGFAGASVSCKLALRLSAIAAAIYLAAIAYDGRHIVNQWTVRASRFEEQHFATLLPVLDGLPRTMILSDSKTSLFLAGSTKHDVVYTLYLKNVLMSHEEIAARYCATQIPVTPVDRHLELQQPIYPDADSAFNPPTGSGDPSVPAREQEMVKKACEEADRDPAAALKRFGVQYVLWDEKRQPTWNLKRLKVPLMKASSGSGWSFWSLKEVSPL